MTTKIVKRNNQTIIFIIPTFGRRRIILKKIEFLDRVFQDENLADLMIYIVFSQPDKKLLIELKEAIAHSFLSSRIRLIIESERRGKAAAINLALNQSIKELMRRPDIVIINDDDAFF